MKASSDTLGVLAVDPPHFQALVVKSHPEVSTAQRERALKACEYNVFSFPADLLYVDLLSDSGTTAMTQLQWSALMKGDESYARNRGYYLLLDALRDTFERGDKPRKLHARIDGDLPIDELMEELYLREESGGFFNGGAGQLRRPNAFITPQGRCAERLLFSTLADVLGELRPEVKQWHIPSNGHFDTTGGNIAAAAMEPVNLFAPYLFDAHEESGDRGRATGGRVGDARVWPASNPFKGNMDVARLRTFLAAHMGQVPLIYLTITNNTAAGQPVSLANMREVAEIAGEWRIPLFFDACRFAENAYFIQRYEAGYKSRSIPSIVKECFSHADGFTISFKKDAMANIGGGLFFRDGGVFQRLYSPSSDSEGNIGTRLKERQILSFGNDAYGGLSGRDIMTIVAGLYEAVQERYLHDRITQVQGLAADLDKAGVPVLLPAGGHAVYVDVNQFFTGTDMRIEDFPGVGLTAELIRHYGIRACELGPFAFEWELKTNEQRRGVLNLVRLALPRNVFNSAHMEYVVLALQQLHRHRKELPRAKIVRGKRLRLRHFQSGLEMIYPATEHGEA